MVFGNKRDRFYQLLHFSEISAFMSATTYLRILFLCLVNYQLPAKSSLNL